jgi:hypothetical protein
MRHQQWDNCETTCKTNWLTAPQPGGPSVDDDSEESEEMVGWLSSGVLRAVAMACMTLEMQGKAGFMERFSSRHLLVTFHLLLAS